MSGPLLFDAYGAEMEQMRKLVRELRAGTKRLVELT
jgi:hypothetical protein